MRLLFSILILAFTAGCSTSRRTASGFYLDYDGKPGHGVVGPLGSTALPLYDLKSQDYREQASVSKIGEDSSALEVAFIFSIITGDVATGPVEQFTFSKSARTKVKLMTGVEVTGHYQK